MIRVPRSTSWLGLATGLMASAAAAQMGVDCLDFNSAPRPQAHFVVMQDGTVRDNRTGLMWKHCIEGLEGYGCTIGVARRMRLRTAISLSEKADFAGYRDWRVPNETELASLIDLRCYGVDIDNVSFPNTPARKFWTSTPSPYYKRSAQRIDFGTGDHDYGTRGDRAYLRLVRDAGACAPARGTTCLSHEDRR